MTNPTHQSINNGASLRTLLIRSGYRSRKGRRAIKRVEKLMTGPAPRGRLLRLWCRGKVAIMREDDTIVIYPTERLAPEIDARAYCPHYTRRVKNGGLECKYCGAFQAHIPVFEIQ